MLKRLLQDWRFYVTLVVGIASVLGPFWLANIDQKSKSLSLMVVSQVSLQPSPKESVSGLEISVEGKPVNSPFSSVIEIKNDGSKPITTNDFEAPLEVHVGSAINIIRAQISKKSPEDIEPDITYDNHVIKLKSTLWNPNDTISISMITSGAQPIFNTKARIVGISSVAVKDSTKPTSNLLTIAILLLAAFALALPTMVCALSLEFYSTQSSKIIPLKRETVIVIGFVNFLFFNLFVKFLNDALGLDKVVWYNILSVLLISGIVIPFSWRLVYPKGADAKTTPTLE